VMSFVAARKRDRLEADEGDLLRVFHRKLHDSADLVVVHVVDDGGRRATISMPASCMFSMARSLTSNRLPIWRWLLGVVADAVELQVGVAHARFEMPCGRIPCSWRIQCRWWRLALSCSRSCARRPRHRGRAGAHGWARPPENCTDIWRRGLILSALSRIFLNFRPQPSS